MRPKVYIMAKAPLMGRAKTRLAADIGPVQANRIYRAMMTKVIRRVKHPKWDTHLAVTPRKWLGGVPEWRGLPQIAQVEGSLTPRLEAVLCGKGSIIVIGTDCPQINTNDIEDAFKALRHNDVVLGPADDGGFWLLGVNGPMPSGLFDKVRWSTQNALDDVASNVKGKTHYLRTLIDVDDAAALRKVWQVKGR